MTATTDRAQTIATLARDRALVMSAASRGGVADYLIPTLTWTDAVPQLGDPIVEGISVYLPANPSYVAALSDPQVHALAAAMGAAAIAARQRIDAARVAAERDGVSIRCAVTGAGIGATR